MVDIRAAPDAAQMSPRGGDRYRRRREDIVAAAIPILNDQGFKGMRLSCVAEQIGLKSTGVTYYFPRKEELAIACIEHGLMVMHNMLVRAEQETSARGRIGGLVRQFVERDADVRRGVATPLTSFSIIRALEGDHRVHASVAYRAMFKRVSGLFDAPDIDRLKRHDVAVRTLILLEQLYWASDWLGQYDLEEFPRLAERISDIMIDGLTSQDGLSLEANELVVGRRREATANENFMRAATREVNMLGYRGASVDRISASLNLTKGAFYHHHDAKVELVCACFRRTFDLIRESQHQARQMHESVWRRLLSVVSALVHFQLSDEGPLIRSAALSSMPRDLQREFVELSYRAGRTFASMISDAIAERSVRPVDPAIAAYMLAAGINAAADLRVWRNPLGVEVAGDYVRPLLLGLLKP